MKFSDTFKAQRLSKKLKRLAFVKKPLWHYKLFEDEMFNEDISSNTQKYRFLIGFWSREELLEYYKIKNDVKEITYN